MASRRELILEAVLALVTAALPDADVARNRPFPEEIPPGGMVNILDGDPGQPEVDLSPLAYNYSHRIPIELAANESPGVTREAAIDALLMPIGAGVAADRTLGGLVDFLQTEAPTSDDLDVTGADTGRWAETALLADYATPDPLT